MRWGWILSLTALAGCSPGHFSSKVSPAPAGVYRTSVNVNPTTLDPVIVQDVETLPIIENVYEGLVSWDEHNRLVPQLAKSWSISADGRTYTFHLREGVKFHNGRPFTAEDVKFSLERACDPILDSPTAANYLGDIVGAKDKMGGKAEDLRGVVVVDPETVKITIDRPRPYFLDKLTYPCAFVVCKDAAPARQEIDDVGAAIGTGPFKVVSFAQQQQLVLTANDDYYLGRPKLNRIEEIVVKDSQTRLDMFRAGDVDNVGLAREDVAGMLKDPVLGRQVVLEPRPAVAYVAMNGHIYAPFKDVRVRQAVAMAIDREQIVNELLGGVSPLADRILPPGIATGDVRALPYDPKRAASLLAKAGYPGGKGLPPLELAIRTQTNDTRIVAEAIVSQLSEKLGMPVTIKSMEWRTMLQARNANKLGFFILSWYADYPDPQNFLSNLLTTDGPGNHFGYSNATVDRLCEAADSNADPAKRASQYEQAERLILADAVWIPLFFIRDAELRSPRIKGVRDNLMGTMPYMGVTAQ